MKFRLAATALLASLLGSCSTPLPQPGQQPKPGMALVKGGSVLNMPGSSQYTYIVGVDGVLLPSWNGSHDVAPGRHRFVFGGSHGSGFKSYMEVTMTVKEGDQFLVEASNWSEAAATYIVYGLPGRKEIYRFTAPLIATGEYAGGEKINAMLVAKGWQAP